MADVILRSESAQSKTPVPNYFIDEYMPHANGEYVKVYLYLLRCMSDSHMAFSVSDTADKFEHTEKDVIRALKFWEKQGLLKMEFDSEGELCCITLISDADQRTAASVSHKKSVSLRTAEAPLREEADSPAPAPSKSPRANADRREMLLIAETYLGRTLNSREVEKLYGWMDDLALSNEVIDYLLDYSISRGHNTFSYMDKIACTWAGAAIHTVEDAKAYSAEHDLAPIYRDIQNTFGISSRTITPSEKEYVRVWVNNMGMPEDVILMACSRSVKNTGKPSFEYADSILKSWHSKGALSIEAVQTLDEEYKAKFTRARSAAPSAAAGGKRLNFEQHDYDIEQLEKQLLKKA